MLFVRVMETKRASHNSPVVQRICHAPRTAVSAMAACLVQACEREQQRARVSKNITGTGRADVDPDWRGKVFGPRRERDLAFDQTCRARQSI